LSAHHDPNVALITSATPADIPVVRRIALDTWPTAYGEILSAEQLHYMLDLMYSEQALVEQMETHGHRFLLAHIGSEALGFTSFASVAETPGHVRLHKLYVLPGQQGKGIGHALLAAVVEAAKAAGHRRLELNVNRFNPALEFYKRAGFRVLRDEVIDIGHGYVMDDHVLELDLSAR